MSGWRERWNKVVTDLEQERDELKLRIHLAKAEGRDELQKLDAKLAELRFRADSAGTEARDAMDDIGEAAKKLAAEVREGFDRVRKTL
ncbi:MAG: hypothetical protein IPI38_00880 [Gemmatimonadetes bacterium]|nr:hypothetical protein [Gemmatimonadota bacterium]MBP6668113.1 hypothetical protein [Gemmatimonadales bacterium]MBK6779280.1 hypothetical protein [Gemmatimonadota bacterium]MBK7348407.1 hypothetical protein [Gemmatimonadota bacterium]MBK7713977.1 hypothetical protein [Gemmatimonadota bacterium]